jgi:hypothetical protein
VRERLSYLRPELPALLAGAALLPFVLLAHGFLPGLVNDGPWNYLLEGDMRCLNEMGTEALRSWCNWYGLPEGYAFMSGGPIVWFGWALMYVTGMGSYAAYLITAAVFDALALAGGYGLMRLLGAGRVIALGTAAAYLISPTVIGMNNFGGTFTGFALLPAYAFADVVTMRALARGDRRLVAAAAAGYVAVRTFALFLDGYSFVVSALLAALLWLAWLAREPVSVRRRLAGVATLAVGQLVAFALYKLYTPAFPDAPPIEIFRSIALDVVTLVAPTDMVWSADLLGLGSEHSDLWGDGTNSAFNYVGIACVALAFVAVVWRFRERYVVALAVAGLVALLLALGPSLKISEVRPALQAVSTNESYLMPEDVATADLPWGGLYTTVPGMEEMRAAYRWSGLTRLVLIVLAGLAIDRLARIRRRRLLAGVVAVVAVVEIAPNMPNQYDIHRANHREREALTAGVIGDLQASTERGERVFFLSPDASYNDYMVNYLAPTMEVRTFNAGGDKNSALARASWPETLTALSGPNPTPDHVRAALESGLDVVVAPYFDLRLATYAWPPPPADRGEAELAYAPILDDSRFEVARYPWFATIRLR